MASTIITFPVHPRCVMQPDFRAELLTTCDEKLALLDESGLDYCLLLDFTPELAALSARQFMELLIRRYNIRTLFIGYDHRFGHDRREGFDDYVRYGCELGIKVLPGKACLPSSLGISGETGEDLRIGSSSIRRLLHEGDVARAADYLGYRYFLNGTVVSGFQVGHKLGYPTANLDVDDPSAVPRWRMVPTAPSRCISSTSMPISTIIPCVSPSCSTSVPNASSTRSTHWPHSFTAMLPRPVPCFPFPVDVSESVLWRCHTVLCEGLTQCFVRSLYSAS